MTTIELIQNGDSGVVSRNKTNNNDTNLNNDKLETSLKGAPNGLAELGSGGQVPISQIPAGVAILKGEWNAATNTPTLIDGSGNAGDTYDVTTGGTQDLGSGSITFNVGDQARYSGTIWYKLDNTDAVNSVFGRTGAVTPQSGDYNADQINQTASREFVTPSQKSLINSALQNGDNVSELNNDANYIDSAGAPVQSVSGKTGVVTLDKSDVDLGNVDNTSDLNKPISTATQTALDSKLEAGDNISALNNDAGYITSSPVQSVNGKTGVVVIDKSDVGLGNVNNVDTTTTANITDSSNKRFVTDANLTKIDNALESSDIGSTVQAFDANTAKTNVAQEFTRQQNFNASILIDAANIAWDLDDNQVASVTLAGNRTLDNPTNMKDGATYILTIKQDISGLRTIAFGSAYKFPAGLTPILSTGSNAVDIISFISDGTNMYGIAQYNFS